MMQMFFCVFYVVSNCYEDFHNWWQMIEDAVQILDSPDKTISCIEMFVSC